MASPKGNVKLSDGREITVDVSTLKVKEWRSFWDPSATVDSEDEIISRLTSLPIADLGDLLQDDFRRIFDKIKELANRPLDNPNSPSASIKP